MTRLLCVVLLATACGTKPGALAHPGGGAQTSDGKPQGDDGHQVATKPHDERDCDKLIAHAVDLGIAERPNDQKPAADERATMQTQLRPTWEPKCKAMTPRAYDCVLAAHTLAELDACGG